VWETERFEDELLAALARSPWWAASAAVHALLFVVLSILLIEPPKPRPQEPRHGAVLVDADLPDALAGGNEAESLPTVEPDVARAPEVEEETAPDLAPWTDLDPLEPSPTPRTAEAPPTRDDAAPPPVVALGPSVIALRSGRTTPSPAPKPPAGSQEPVNLDPDRAHEVNREAAARLRGALRKDGGPLGKALKGLKREDIVVVRGSFDHMEAVVEELRLPYSMITPAQAAEDYDWPRHKVVFWNCGELVVPPRLRQRLHTALREFVRGGGYLFTTDWAIHTVLVPSFPGTLATDGGARPIQELVLSVRAAKGAENHALLDGVFDEGPEITWWLENSSFDVQVPDRTKVDVLVEAPSLGQPPHDRSPCVAATFSFGRGRVLHVMGHYFQQKGTVSGAAGAHRIALNFVRMRLERDAAGAPK
jgi:hypothetical protein